MDSCRRTSGAGWRRTFGKSAARPGSRWRVLEVAYGEAVRGTDPKYVVSGPLGRDTIDGGTGNDQLFGGADLDTIAGGGGTDAIRRGNQTVNRGTVDITTNLFLQAWTPWIERLAIDGLRTQGVIRFVGNLPSASVTPVPNSLFDQVPPGTLNVSVSGPTQSVTGQPLTYTAQLNLGSLPDDARTQWRVVEVSSNRLINVGTGNLLAFSPTQTGRYQIQLAVMNGSGAIGIGSIELQVTTTLLTSDPQTAGSFILWVGGTAGNDTIEILRTVSATDVRVRSNDGCHRRRMWTRSSPT